MSKFWVLFIVLLYGCVSSPKENEDTVEKPMGDFSIKVVDSCEYIEYDYGWADQRVYSLTHKGNCKYCIERSKKISHETKNNS